MKTVYVIHERDVVDGDSSVIGVSSTPEKAMEMIDDFYGVGKVGVTKRDYVDIRDSNLEFSVEIDVSGLFGGTCLVTVMDFDIDRL